ncbi:uncharacterized protein LOC101859829, partial [Aplysia californica]
MAAGSEEDGEVRTDVYDGQKEERRLREEEAGGGKKEGEEKEDVDSNAMWNTLYKIGGALEPLMPSDRNSNGVCPKSATDSCPSGHQLKQCKTGQGFFCEQCSDKTFQPNENWMGDKCRLRRNCRKANMYYLDEGSTTRNANCACIDGYHFPNEDQRACFSNPICQKGYAPGMYGNCESCQKKGMFSDTVGRVKKCKPLTNCEKRGRCTDVKSNGQFDNICGPKVTDLSTCKEIEPSSSSSDVLKIAIPAGIIGALLLIILFIFFVRRKKYRRQQSSKRVLTVEEMDELKLRITKASDRDPAVCKKVLTTSCSFIEERIERQIWDLARELFRPHHIDGKYELIVDKYKESQAKYTVNGYLLEWRDWRGDSKDAVAELFRCLRQVKRDDIINEICACLRNDIEFSEDSQRQSRHSSNKKSMRDECVYIFFPCCYGGKEKSSSSSSSS